MTKQKNKNFLLFYNANGIKTYKTPLKPLGYFVGFVGFVLIIFGFITLPLPTGSIFAISGGFALLGLVGINPYVYKKKLLDKARFFYWRYLK